MFVDFGRIMEEAGVAISIIKPLKSCPWSLENGILAEKGIVPIVESYKPNLVPKNQG